MICLFIRWWTHKGLFGGCAEVTSKWPQNHNKSLFVSCEMGNKIKAQFVLHITSYVVAHAVSPRWIKFYPLKTRSGNSNSHTINYFNTDRQNNHYELIWVWWYHMLCTCNISWHAESAATLSIKVRSCECLSCMRATLSSVVANEAGYALAKMHPADFVKHHACLFQWDLVVHARSGGVNLVAKWLEHGPKTPQHRK